MNIPAKLYISVKPCSPLLWAAVLSVVNFVSATDIMIYLFTKVGLSHLIPSDHNWQSVISCVLIFFFFLILYLFWLSFLKTFIDHGLLEHNIASNKPTSFSSVLNNSIRYHDSKMEYFRRNIPENDIKSHVENVLVDILLYDVRHAFSTLYNHPGFCVSIFLPVIVNEGNTIMYEAFTTKFDQNERDRLIYAKNEGFCGWAWANNEPQAGARKKSIFGIVSIKDIRYYNGSGLKRNNSFLCLPVTGRHHPHLRKNDSGSVVAVLSIDSIVKEDFKCQHNIVQQLEGSLRCINGFIFDLIKDGKLTAELKR